MIRFSMRYRLLGQRWVGRKHVDLQQFALSSDSCDHFISYVCGIIEDLLHWHKTPVGVKLDGLILTKLKPWNRECLYCLFVAFRIVSYVTHHKSSLNNITRLCRIANTCCSRLIFQSRPPIPFRRAVFPIETQKHAMFGLRSNDFLIYRVITSDTERIPYWM